FSSELLRSCHSVVKGKIDAYLKARNYTSSTILETAEQEMDTTLEEIIFEPVGTAPVFLTNDHGYHWYILIIICVLMFLVIICIVCRKYYSFISRCYRLLCQELLL
ncbi:unnamed protein product, partial [Meganyctiphanes norvegica]